MTVIAAAINKNRAAVGCDSQVSGTGTKDRVTPSKLLAVGPSASPYGYLGVTGAAIAIELIKEVAPPANDTAEEWDDYLSRVSAKLRKEFSNPFSGGARILAVNKTTISDVLADGVFPVQSHNGVTLAAVGSGGHIALGSMRASTQGMLPWSPDKVVRQGIEAAIELAEGCGEPVTIHKL